MIKYCVVIRQWINVEVEKRVQRIFNISKRSFSIFFPFYHFSPVCFAYLLFACTKHSAITNQIKSNRRLKRMEKLKKWWTKKRHFVHNQKLSICKVPGTWYLNKRYWTWTFEIWWSEWFAPFICPDAKCLCLMFMYFFCFFLLLHYLILFFLLHCLYTVAFSMP